MVRHRHRRQPDHAVSRWRRRYRPDHDGVSGEQEFPESSAQDLRFPGGAGIGFDLGAGFASGSATAVGTTETQLAWNSRDSATDDVLQTEVLLHNIDLGISYWF